jgi:putative transposase
MTIPTIGTVLRSTNKFSPLLGVHRVLWVNKDKNLIILICIPLGIKEAPITYFPAPFNNNLATVVRSIDEGDLVITAYTPFPLAACSDEEIRQRYPMRKGVVKKRVRKDSAPLQTRDELYELIAPLRQEIANDPASVFETNRIAVWIQQRATELGVPVGRIRNAIHKFLAMSLGKNGLLPFLDECGCVGKPRKQVNGKLGRKTWEAKLGLICEPGIPLTQKDKDHIAWGWNRFLREGHSVRDAYLITMAAFWANGQTMYQGREVPALKSLSERPTLAQFRYWGPRGYGAKSAWETLLKPGEWEKKYRGLYGTARDGVKAVGQIASGDSTSNDVHLVSTASYLKSIGTATVMRFHDVFSDCVVGVALSLDAPSALLAQLAIYNAASDKVEFCRRYGVIITPEKFPSAFYRLYHYDNGELRSQSSIMLLKDFDSNAEFVQAGRAELKPVPEAGHRRFHKMLDHKIAGTTRGRRKERGEAASAISACWTYWQYMRELLLAIIYHNTEADASHLLTVEMRRDGVAPNRAAIHQWAIQKSYVASLPVDINHLRIRLLPKIQAVVRPNGIFLLRPDRDNKRELVRGARFVGPRAVQLLWFEKARRTGPFDITVYHDPYDLEKIWFVDGAGTHDLINVVKDSVLIREGTLPDVVSIQDDDRLQRLLHQDESEQQETNFVIDRYEKNETNKKAKRDEVKATGRRVTKTEMTSNIAKNRAEEAVAIAREVDPVSRAPRSHTDIGQDMEDGVSMGASRNVGQTGGSPDKPPHVTHDLVEDALDAFRKEAA